MKKHKQFLTYSKQFLAYYRPYRGMLLVDLLCALLISATTLAFPLCVRHITHTILQENPPDRVAQIGVTTLFMLILLAIYAASVFYVDYRGHMMGTLIERDMRRDLFAHYQKLSFSFYDEHRTGDLLSRITNDLVNISELAHHGPEDFMIALLNFIGIFIILLLISVPMTLIVFAFILLMLVYAFYFHRRLYPSRKAYRQQMGMVNNQVEDSLAGIRVVQSFANEALEQAKFDRVNQQFVESRERIYLLEGYNYSGMQSFTQFLPMVVIVAGSITMSYGHLHLADLITILLYTASLTTPITHAINISHWLQEGMSGFSRFMDILAIEPAISDTAPPDYSPALMGDITLQDVAFRYQPHLPPVLDGLSLTMARGEFVALVGVSGVGKSTLCALIPRFYDVTAGRILINGHDVKDLPLQYLRSQIGFVHQDVYLFAGTVEENIRYGQENASQVDVIAAAQRAHAHDFIMRLPDGYQTEIGQRGVKLSGGQKQRLSIARVFLRNPPIIIFDEATSALDNESERAIQQAIESLSQNRTLIVIAHRLSTIEHADRIIVLGAGGICEEGSHRELIARNGMYANLYHDHAMLFT